jgi:hypothetical protein
VTNTHEAKGDKQLIDDKKKTQNQNSAMLDATAPAHRKNIAASDGERCDGFGLAGSE